MFFSHGGNTRHPLAPLPPGAPRGLLHRFPRQPGPHQLPQALADRPRQSVPPVVPPSGQGGLPRR